MNLHRLRVIAGKELLDHLTDRRFLLIAGVLLLVVSIGLVGGLTTYKASIDRYASIMGTIGEHTTDIRQTAGGSLLVVINSVGNQILLLGAILGIAMGFDLITKEKEGGSLKLLLSHPIFRDEVINGKGLGGLGAIAGLVLVTFLIMVAILLVFGIVPNGYEIFAILVLALISFLLIFSYFSIALLMSTISRTGGTALIAALIVFIALSSLLPIFVDSNVTGVFIGKEPEPPIPTVLPAEQIGATVGEDGESLSTSGLENVSAPIGITDEAMTRYEQQLQAYEEKRSAIESVVSLLSPTLNFRQVVKKMSVPLATIAAAASSTDTTSKGGNGASSPEPISIPSVLESVIPNLIALLVIPTVFFGLSYVRFMRLDVR